jgi:CHASE1-domain containing sensor protein
MERIPSQGVAAKHIIAMKFSTEAIVALAVAVVFALLTLGAIAREQEQEQEPARAGHTAYIAANNVNLSQVAASRTDVLGFY